MPDIRVKVDARSIQAKLNKALANSDALKRKAYQKMLPFFNQAKKRMLKDFDTHPVTRELENGPDSSEGNISGTLSGYEEANLFAFLGFEVGTNPVEELRELLVEGTTFRLSSYRDKKYYFHVSVPSTRAIAEVAPTPGWSIEGNWVDGIEKGFSNLEYFVWKHWEGGRSHEGFQIAYPYADDAQFTPRPYLTEILDNFKDSMENI